MGAGSSESQSMMMFLRNIVSAITEKTKRRGIEMVKRGSARKPKKKVTMMGKMDNDDDDR
jgi:hypothetical protein